MSFRIVHLTHYPNVLLPESFQNVPRKDLNDLMEVLVEEVCPYRTEYELDMEGHLFNKIVSLPRARPVDFIQANEDDLDADSSDSEEEPSPANSPLKHTFIILKKESHHAVYFDLPYEEIGFDHVNKVFPALQPRITAVVNQALSL